MPDLGAADDGSGGFTGIAPVGEVFVRAVAESMATPDFYGAEAAGV